MLPPRFTHAALAILSLAPQARAELPDERDHALPCRPTIACTADLVPPGSFEVEGGVLYRRLGSAAQSWTTPLLLKQTLTEALQLQVGSNGYTAVGGDLPARYLDDLVLGPKLHFLDQGTIMPSVSVSAELSVPTFHRSGYQRSYDGLFTAYVTKDLGLIHLDVNGGVNLWRIEDHPIRQEFGALALSMNLVGALGAMVEGYVFSDARPVTPHDGGFLFALSQTPRPWLVLDEGGDLGFYPRTRSVSLFVGMTIIPAVFRATAGGAS